MKRVKASFEEFAGHIKTTGNKIVFFGAGAIGRVLIPYICHRYQLDERVLCYIDNNPAKQNQEIELSSRRVKIFSIDYLEQLQNENYVIMITNGDFFPVLEQLEERVETQGIEVYIAPVMQLQEKEEAQIEGIYKCSDKPLIPKVIHYCWFSGNPIPENLKKCIDSWKEKCPDYEIIRWDESNYDVNKYVYTRQAYAAKKWGFIPDIARLELLYEYGGFYLDTDVELLKSLDELRYQPAFCGREDWGHVNFGGGSGCERHFDLVGELLDFRKDIPFLLPDGKLNPEASGYFETKPLMDKGLQIRNRTEVVENLTVYASEFFHPYNYISGKENITENTVSIHYFSGGWLGEAGKRYRSETKEKFDTIVSSMEMLMR